MFAYMMYNSMLEQTNTHEPLQHSMHIYLHVPFTISRNLWSSGDIGRYEKWMKIVTVQVYLVNTCDTKVPADTTHHSVVCTCLNYSPPCFLIL